MKHVFTSTVLVLSLWGFPAGAFENSGGHPFFVPNRGGSPRSLRYYSRTEQQFARFEDRGISLATPLSEARVASAGAGPASTVSSAGDSLFYRGTWLGIETEMAPGRSRVHYESRSVPWILADGSSRAGVRGGEFMESAPDAYREDGGRAHIQAAHHVFGDGPVGLKPGPDDSLHPFIDPVMNYSTYFGGSGNTTVTSVAFDTYGNAIVAGWTVASDLPANGARTKNSGSVDAFVAKVSAEGNRIVWCTYLGGSGDDRAFGVAVDSSNNVYVTGWTQSSNFPLMGAIQTKLSGGRDAFVTKLNSSGTAILYSTYLGGNNYDQGNAIRVDSTGAAYITGNTTSTNFPAVNAYQPLYGGQQDAFIAKLNAAGNALLFSTYLGGYGVDQGAGIALDASLNVYITGSTYSSNFPVVNATQPIIGGGEDAFVAELSPGGNVLLFGTFIGGSGGTAGLEEIGNAVAVDVSGNVYVAGVTSSSNFPTTAGAYQQTLNNAGADDHGFAWKINSSKTQIIYSTYLAGTNMDLVNGLAVDPAGNAYLVGSTSSTNFPIVRAFQAAITGLTSAFILKLNPTGSGLIFGSYLGGSASDTAYGVAVDFRQNIVIGGVSSSGDFPLQNAAQSYSNASLSGFVTRVVPGWYPITFSNALWDFDVWRDDGFDGASSTQTHTYYGEATDLPIVGDWNGTGATKIGIFRNGLWVLNISGTGQNSPSDRQFTFGQAGDVPIVGDWDGTGFLKAGLFRKGQFILDLSGHMSGVPTGKQDLTFTFGLSTDIPVAGDWGSTGVTKVGIFRNGTWMLDTNNNHAWDAGDQTLYYGTAGDIPVVGDWDGSGTVKIGISRAGCWTLNIGGTGQYQPGVDITFSYGNSTNMFLVGH